MAGVGKEGGEEGGLFRYGMVRGGRVRVWQV